MRRFSLLLALAMSLTFAPAQGGWSVSPVETIPRTPYPVYGDMPPCDAEGYYFDGELALYAVLLSSAVRITLGLELSAPGLATVAGHVLNAMGEAVIFQRFTSCKEICAAIPLSAQRITKVRAFGSLTAGGPWVEVPPLVRSDHLALEGGIDTSRIVGDERLVCVVTKNRDYDRDRQHFFIFYYD